MTRILSLLALAATVLFSNSCCICCTSDTEAPKLKPLPPFKEFAPAPEVDNAK